MAATPRNGLQWCAAPVNPGGVQAAAGGGDGFLDRSGVMLQAGSQRLFIAENQQRFRRRLCSSLVKSPGQQHSNGARLRLERGRQLGELARFDPRRGLQRRMDRLAQFGEPLARAGDQRQHRHAQLLGQLHVINVVPILLRHIHHVQRDQRGMAQFDHLGGVVQVALQVRRIHHHHDHRGRGQLRQPVEQHVARNLLVQGLRAQAVGAGQIEHARVQPRRRAQQPAFLALHRHAGVVADFGAQTGQRVEQRRLAAVRIAGQDDVRRRRRTRLRGRSGRMGGGLGWGGLGGQARRVPGAGRSRIHFQSANQRQSLSLSPSDGERVA